MLTQASVEPHWQFNIAKWRPMSLDILDIVVVGGGGGGLS